MLVIFVFKSNIVTITINSDTKGLVSLTRVFSDLVQYKGHNVSTDKHC